MKTHEATLKTAGKTIEQIMVAYESGEKPSLEFAQKIKESYDLIDGCKIIVGEASFREDSYSLLMWQEVDDHKFMEFTYIAEQDAYFGSYIDMWDEFEKDWVNEEYDPPGAMVFDKADVILKVSEKE